MNSEQVRGQYLANAGYWVREFHMDRLRLDATQNICDFKSDEHMLSVVVRAVSEAATDRETLIVGEHEPQHVKFSRYSVAVMD